MTRNYSCFCQPCLSSDFAQCENYQFTKGKFIKRDLPSGSINVSIDENANSDEDVDENGEEVDNCYEIEKERADIVVEKKEVSFHDLQVKDLIIVTLQTSRGKIRQCVAMVKEVENEDTINIVYLNQKPDLPEVFTVDNINDTDTVDLDDIIMKLPDPLYYHRGRYVFQGPVLLNK